MLYQSKIKEGKEGTMDKLRSLFEELYKKYNIEILGAWANLDNPSETFYISKYEDENDYRRKTEELRKDKTYAELTAKLQEIRVSSTSTRLKHKWLPE
jgi:hypothetical protein